MLTRTQIDALKTIVVQKNKLAGDLTRRVLWYLIENSACGTKNVSLVLEEGEGENEFRNRDVVLVELYIQKLLNEVIYLNTLCELAGTDLRFCIDKYRDSDKREYTAFSFRDTNNPQLETYFISYQTLAKVDLDIPEALRRKK